LGAPTTPSTSCALAGSVYCTERLELTGAALGGAIRINIGPIIDRGLKLC
jgi:hypothetical protein